MTTEAAEKASEQNVIDQMIAQGGEFGQAVQDIVTYFETTPDDPLVLPPSNERFEGEDYHTIMMGYDSMASWYITRNACLFLSIPRPSDMYSLLYEMMERFAYCRVRVANDIYAPYGMAFVCPDKSRILLLQAPVGSVDPRRKWRRMDQEFVLIRLTGTVIEDGIYYVDFGYSPPVASLNEPKPIDPMHPAKHSMYTRDNYNKGPWAKDQWSPA